jgi:hypothetical protein
VRIAYDAKPIFYTLNIVICHLLCANYL